MKIETKFAKDDSVYIMHGSIAKKDRIRGIEIKYGKGKPDKQWPQFGEFDIADKLEPNKDVIDIVYHFANCSVCEQELFATKAELMEATFGQLT